MLRNTGWTGLLFTEDIDGIGVTDSGWQKWPAAIGAISRAGLRLVPSGIGALETLDVVIALAFNEDGAGAFDVFTSAQFTDDTPQVCILPQGSNLIVPGDLTPSPLPLWYRSTQTAGGTNPVFTYNLYGALL